MSEEKRTIWNEISEIKRAVAYMAKCIDSISKKIEKQNNIDYLHELYVETLKLELKKITTTIIRDFKILAAGQAYQDLCREEFEQWKKEFLKVLEEKEKMLQKEFFEEKHRMLERIENSINEVMIFYKDEQLKKILKGLPEEEREKQEKHHLNLLNDYKSMLQKQNV